MDWKKREQSVENNIWKPNTGWWKTPLENTEEKYEIEPEDSGEKETPQMGKIHRKIIYKFKERMEKWENKSKIQHITTGIQGCWGSRNPTYSSWGEHGQVQYWLDAECYLWKTTTKMPTNH